MTAQAPSYRATLSTYLGPLRGRVVLLGLLLLGSIGLQLVIPLILADFIDSALAGSAAAGLTTAGIAYLIAGIVNQLLDAGASYLGTDIGWSATNRLREESHRDPRSRLIDGFYRLANGPTVLFPNRVLRVWVSFQHWVRAWISTIQVRK